MLYLFTIYEKIIKIGGFSMTLPEAQKILGNRAKWELQNMKKALSFLGALNSEEENLRLEACKVMLKNC
jgi:hypothetical protein